MTSGGGVVLACDDCDVWKVLFHVGVDGRAGVGSLAGGGVGRFDSGTQLAKYLSSSSSVMSLMSLCIERAGENSIVSVVVCLLACFFSFVLLGCACLALFLFNRGWGCACACACACSVGLLYSM